MASNTCWGLEIGSGAVKGVLLARDDAEVRILDHIIVPHPKVLSTPDVDEAEAVRVALGALVSQRNLKKADVAISAPGTAGFARFAKLPPVEPKKVPDIVKFEAVQQIPFPIEEVEWDFQTFQKRESPDIEVGIFAMTRDRVMQRLNWCEQVGIEPVSLTISPVAVYNAMAFDLGLTPASEPIVFLDIGTVSTDLIVADAGRIWIRTFPQGGHAFTEAIADAFKLPYTKAEKLKREAERSRHKRHIFQAMRAVFADFAQEVQRSISYYNQLHPETELKRIVGLGSTFRLLGLRRYLSQQLQMEALRLEQFSRAQIEGANASELQSEALCLTTAYGVALQGVGLATIDANLIPMRALRQHVWRRKPAWLATAAALSVAAGVAAFYQPVVAAGARDAARNSPAVAGVDRTVSLAQSLRREAESSLQAAVFGAKADNVVRLFTRRDLMQRVALDLGELLASGGGPGEVAALISSGRLLDMPPGDWPVFQVRAFDVDYVTPSGASPQAMADAAAPGGGATRNAEPSTSGGGRALGGLGGGAPPPAFEDPRAARGREPAPGAERVVGASPSPNGKLIFRLLVDSPNKGATAFVDGSILKWIRDNADRPDAPYTFVPIDFNQIARAKVEQKREAQTPVAGDLEGLAPLPPAPPGFPESADVYRYTIQWEALLKPPTSSLDLPIGASPVAQARAGGGAP